MASKKKTVTAKVKTAPRLTATSTQNSSLMLLALAAAVLVISYMLFMKVSREVSESANQMGLSVSRPGNMMMDSNKLSVQLNEQNNSGEYGNALITEENGVVHVHVSVKNAPRGISQPAHIHVGTCIDTGAVKYPLTNLLNGVSDTTLQVSLKDLASQGPLVLNVHKSVSQIKDYVSCGNL
jgi:flagellar capping protein FliD